MYQPRKNMSQAPTPTTKNSRYGIPSDGALSTPPKITARGTTERIGRSGSHHQPSLVFAYIRSTTARPNQATRERYVHTSRRRAATPGGRALITRTSSGAWTAGDRTGARTATDDSDVRGSWRIPKKGLPVLRRHADPW